ncbi:MAG: hypothetical protein ACYDAC_12705 [Candidatus Dormibacteria bacterium]
MRHFDGPALYAALDSRKDAVRLSWRELAQELELKDHTVFTRLSKGQLPGVDVLLTLCGWLGTSVEAFADGGGSVNNARAKDLELVRQRLGGLRGLHTDDATALRLVLEAAAEQMERSAGTTESEPITRVGKVAADRSLLTTR